MRGVWGEQKPFWLLLAFMLTCWPLGVVTHGFPSSDGLEADLPVVREYRAVLAPPCVGGKILSLGFQVLSQESLVRPGSFHSVLLILGLMYILSTYFRMSSAIYIETPSAIHCHKNAPLKITSRVVCMYWMLVLYRM